MALFCWGVLWWFGGGFNEIDDHVVAILSTSRCSDLLGRILRRVQRSSLSHRLARSEICGPVRFCHSCIVCRGWKCDTAAHPFEYLGSSPGRRPSPSICGCCAATKQLHYVDWWHAAGVWLFAALGAWEVGWWIGELVRGGDVWRLIGWPLVPLVLRGLALGSRRAHRLAGRPLSKRLSGRWR